jgi:hypothetical protein
MATLSMYERGTSGMADETDPGDEPHAENPKYDQDFIALAAKGKEAWNEWRRNPANEKVRVTFAGIDFSVAPNQINFQGFEFGDGADRLAEMAVWSAA